MNPTQQRAFAAFKRGIADLKSSLAVFNPREEAKAGGEHGELEIRTDGFDEVLTSGEKCVAYEMVQALKLYGMWPEEGAGKC